MTDDLGALWMVVGMFIVAFAFVAHDLIRRYPLFRMRIGVVLVSFPKTSAIDKALIEALKRFGAFAEYTSFGEEGRLPLAPKFDGAVTALFCSTFWRPNPNGDLESQDARDFSTNGLTFQIIGPGGGSLTGTKEVVYDNLPVERPRVKIAFGIRASEPLSESHPVWGRLAEVVVREIMKRKRHAFGSPFRGLDRSIVRAALPDRGLRDPATSWPQKGR